MTGGCAVARGNRWERHGDPVKRAERKARRREQEARGTQHLPRKPRPTAQLDHASNPRARKHAREGEAAMNRERLAADASEESE